MITPFNLYSPLPSYIFDSFPTSDPLYLLSEGQTYSEETEGHFTFWFLASRKNDSFYKPLKAFKKHYQKCRQRENIIVVIQEINNYAMPNTNPTQNSYLDSEEQAVMMLSQQLLEQMKMQQHLPSNQPKHQHLQLLPWVEMATSKR